MTGRDVNMPITISKIDIPDGRRDIVAASVKNLADSINKVGLRHPITVLKKGDRYILVAGLHRIEAHKNLGLDHIPATIVTMTDDDARLWEIAENLHRAELSKLERDDNIAEWIRITERQSSQVATNESKRSDGRGHRAESGVNAAARELGVDKDDAHRAVKVASLSDEAKDAAREHHLDNNRSALLAAASKPTVAEQVAEIHQRHTAKVENYNPKHYVRLKKLKGQKAASDSHHTAITEFVANIESNFSTMAEKFTPDELSDLFLRIGQAIVKWRAHAETSAKSSKPKAAVS